MARVSSRLLWKTRYAPPDEQREGERGISSCFYGQGRILDGDIWLTMDAQPRPLAAIDLIHKQPVRWTQKKVVSCDGGGGPLGHPRIFINTDKPQICACTYCGVPYVSSRHRYARVSTMLTTARHTSTTASTSKACPPHLTLSRPLTTRLLFLPLISRP